MQAPGAEAYESLGDEPSQVQGCSGQAWSSPRMQWSSLVKSKDAVVEGPSSSMLAPRILKHIFQSTFYNYPGSFPESCCPLPRITGPSSVASPSTPNSAGDQAASDSNPVVSSLSPSSADVKPTNRLSQGSGE
ncbi:hypothetical protein CDV31_014073 [Fusarium ambrosium]|uniref:Uncharacterized protein n=1 Tax=Fusarium ambrosium TaxID=131363 RepID=A0A428SZ36_9HYPO|nr:hypothetical protein CDV31_014073 [Fusarium ambrosium]